MEVYVIKLSGVVVMSYKLYSLCDLEEMEVRALV